MKRNFVAIAFTALILGLCCMSCEKENNPKSCLDQSLIRKFENVDQLVLEMQRINQMDFDDILKYEDNNGYTSYGQLEYLSLEEVTKDTTITLDKLHQLVDERSDFLKIYEEKGELFLDIKYDDTPFSFIMNKDRMFIVAEQVYKVFENCLIITDMEHYDELHNLNEKDIKGIEDGEYDYPYVVIPNFNFDNNPTASYLKEIDTIGINDKEKIRSTITASVLEKRKVAGQTVVTTGLFIKSKGFRKFIIFWPVKRTISHHIEGALYSNGDISDGFDYSQSFTFCKETTLTYRTKTLPPYVNNPTYGIYFARGDANIPAVSVDYDYHH